MVRFALRLAGMLIDVTVRHDHTRAFCGDWVTDPDESADSRLAITVTQADIDAERAEASREYTKGSPRVAAPDTYGDDYLETLALYRKIAEALTARNILLFHGSVVAVDGQAYIFTAPSGTGKSTHTRLWRELLGDKAIMVNDDKPLFRFDSGEVRAFGTPWRGKHALGSNISAPVAGICLIKQAPDNHIEPVNGMQGLPWLLQQSYRPKNTLGAQQYLDMVMRLSKQIPLWQLDCTPTIEAARLSYTTMSRRSATRHGESND